MSLAGPEAAVRAALERAYLRRTKLLATLLRQFRDFELAEDALQEAFEQALVQWPKELPSRPTAWLLTTARRRALDGLRRIGTRQRHRTSVEREIVQRESAAASELEGDLGDEVLSMLFACCHPAIAPESRVALMLQVVCGLSSEQIARAYLVPHSTLAQRIVRAKRKIRDAGVPLRVPPGERLAERLAEVLLSIYLIYNEGHTAGAGSELGRADLCREAVRLADLVARLLPKEPEASGLLVLLQLNEARRPARIDEDGMPVRLQDQDRSRWERQRIASASALLERTLRRGRAGPYQVQAAIQALHCEATSWEQTDWLQILGLYEILEGMQPTPVVRLNRAVAAHYARGPHKALALLDTLEDHDRQELAEYAPYHAARAEFLAALGRIDEAVECLNGATSRSQNEVQRRFFRRRIRQLGETVGGGS